MIGLTTKEVAQILRMRASLYRKSTLKDAQVKVLEVGDFKIRCLGNEEALLKVAAKFEKARDHSLKRVPKNYHEKKRDQFSQLTLASLVKLAEDGEGNLTNVIEYCKRFNVKPVFYRLVGFDKNERTDKGVRILLNSIESSVQGFTVGRKRDNNNNLGKFIVIHNNSGAILRSDLKTQKEAVEFCLDAESEPETVSEFIKNYETGFQELCWGKYNAYET